MTLTPEQLSHEALKAGIISDDKLDKLTNALNALQKDNLELYNRALTAIAEMKARDNVITVGDKPHFWESKAEKKRHELADLMSRRDELQTSLNKLPGKIDKAEKKREKAARTKQAIENRYKNVRSNRASLRGKVGALFGDLNVKETQAKLDTKVQRHQALVSEEAETRTNLEQSKGAQTEILRNYGVASESLQGALRTIRLAADMTALQTGYNTVRTARTAVPPRATTPDQDRSHDLYLALQNPDGLPPARARTIVNILLRGTPWGDSNLRIARSLPLFRGDMAANLWWARGLAGLSRSEQKTLGNEVQKLMDAGNDVETYRLNVSEVERIQSTRDHANALIHAILDNDEAQKKTLQASGEILTNFLPRDAAEENGIFYNNPLTGERFTVKSAIVDGKRTFALPDGTSASRDAALLASRNMQKGRDLRNVFFAGGLPALPAGLQPYLDGIYAPFTFTPSLYTVPSTPPVAGDIRSLQLAWQYPVAGAIESGTLSIPIEELPATYAIAGGVRTVNLNMTPVTPGVVPPFKKLLDEKLKAERAKELKQTILNDALTAPSTAAVGAAVVNAFNVHATPAKGIPAGQARWDIAAHNNPAGTRDGLELQVHIAGTQRLQRIAIPAQEIPLNMDKLITQPAALPEIDQVALNRYMEQHVAPIAALIPGEDYLNRNNAPIEAKMQMDAISDPIMGRCHNTAGTPILTLTAGATGTPPTPAQFTWTMDRYAEVDIVGWTQQVEAKKLEYTKNGAGTITGVNTKPQLEEMAKMLEPLEAEIKNVASLVNANLTPALRAQLTEPPKVTFDATRQQYVLELHKKGSIEKIPLDDTYIRATWTAGTPGTWALDATRLGTLYAAAQNALRLSNTGITQADIEKQVRLDARTDNWLKRANSTFVYTAGDFEWTMTQFAHLTIPGGVWASRPYRADLVTYADVGGTRKAVTTGLLDRMGRDLQELDQTIEDDVPNQIMAAIHGATLVSQIDGRPKVKFDDVTGRYILEVKRVSGASEKIALDAADLTIGRTITGLWAVATTPPVINRVLQKLSLMENATTLAGNLQSAILATPAAGAGAVEEVRHEFTIDDDPANKGIELLWTLRNYKGIKVTGWNNVKIPLTPSLLTPATGIVTGLDTTRIIALMEPKLSDITDAITSIPSALAKEVRKIHNDTHGAGSYFSAPTFGTIPTGTGGPLQIPVTLPGATTPTPENLTGVTLKWDAASQSWSVNAEALARDIFNRM